MALSMTFDLRQVRDLERRLALAGREAGKELDRAMTGARRATLTQATRSIASRYTLLNKRIRDDLFVFGNERRVGPRLGRATGLGLGAGTYGFTLLGRRQPISFGSYGARATGNGVTVAIRRGRRQLLSGAFVGLGPSATSESRRDVQRRARYAGQIRTAYGRNVNNPNALFWVRTGGAKRRMSKGYNEGLLKEPIRPLFGPSIADHLLQQSVRDEIDRNFINRLGNEYTRRLARLTGR